MSLGLLSFSNETPPPLFFLPTGQAAATPLQWTGVKWLSSGWRRKKQRGGKKLRGWHHGRHRAPWSRAHPCLSLEMPHPCWMKWTDRTQRTLFHHPPPSFVLYLTGIAFCLSHNPSNSSSGWPPAEAHTIQASIHRFSSSPDIVVAAVSLVWRFMSAPSFFLSCLPISYRTFYIVTSGQSTLAA